jgi:hypothetical protein
VNLEFTWPLASRLKLPMFAQGEQLGVVPGWARLGECGWLTN